MNLQQLVDIKKGLDDWLHEGKPLFSVAKLLGATPIELQEVLYQNGLCDFQRNPNTLYSATEVLEIILLHLSRVGSPQP